MGMHAEEDGSEGYGSGEDSLMWEMREMQHACVAVETGRLMRHLEVEGSSTSTTWMSHMHRCCCLHVFCTKTCVLSKANS